jgi:hypothetical protein
MRPQLFCKLQKNVKREKLLHITCFWSHVLDFFLNLGQAIMALESLHISKKYYQTMQTQPLFKHLE